MSEPSLSQKIAFLSRPEAYPGAPARVEIKETHMSCVFLTDRHAWKLKKPVCYDYMDFRTLESRKRDCRLELVLNRRLAESVYLAVVPLVLRPCGAMQLGGNGRIVDWLVQMRRLPERLMLDAEIAAGTVQPDDVRRLGEVLARFYQTAERIPLGPEEYTRRLEAETGAWAGELGRKEYGLPADSVESIRARQIAMISRECALFSERAERGRIVDAHGDLRPEHICMEPQPVIIDCLEFHAGFRVLDPVSELAFLGLECERLGAPWIADTILDTYRRETGDCFPERLSLFYKRHHACVRAQISVWHLKDPAVQNPAKWVAKAKDYLRRAESIEQRHD